MQAGQGGTEHGGGLQRAVVGGAEVAFAPAEALSGLVFGLGGPLQCEQRRGPGHVDRTHIVCQLAGTRGPIEDVLRLLDGSKRLLGPSLAGQRPGRPEVQHRQEPALALPAYLLQRRKQQVLGLLVVAVELEAEGLAVGDGQR